MPPAPKPAGQRRRRNTDPSSAKLLRPDSRPVDDPPAFPLGDGATDFARGWWVTVWSSPMAQVYLHADVPALVRCCQLVDKAARCEAGAQELAEISQLEDRFGLSPLARRRLQWEIDQAAAGEAAGLPDNVTEMSKWAQRLP